MLRTSAFGDEYSDKTDTITGTSKPYVYKHDQRRWGWHGVNVTENTCNKSPGVALLHLAGGWQRGTVSRGLFDGIGTVALPTRKLGSIKLALKERKWWMWSGMVSSETTSSSKPPVSRPSSWPSPTMTRRQMQYSLIEPYSFAGS